METVLALQPDAIVMPCYGGTDPVLARLANEPAWRGVAALAKGRVREVPGAWISTVSHHAARGLAHVARLLHPEAFDG
jgi:ABC-type Fe3+-hydroxamate transport system substrate-binding protein